MNRYKCSNQSVSENCLRVDLNHYNFDFRVIQEANLFVVCTRMKFWLKKRIKIYSMKQLDLYYFETIKMTSQAQSNFVWRIRATGEYSL